MIIDISASSGAIHRRNSSAYSSNDHTINLHTFLFKAIHSSLWNVVLFYQPASKFIESEGGTDLFIKFVFPIFQHHDLSAKQKLGSSAGLQANISSKK